MRWFVVGLSLGVMTVAIWLIKNPNRSGNIISPLSGHQSFTLVPNKYWPYRFETLSQKHFSGNKIKLTAKTKDSTRYSTHVFIYQSDEKTISGMANIPKGSGPFPVIILLRGYADRETYYVGHGTEKQANYYADRGFVTLAPDFLGYGYSDWEDQDILVARFYRPVEVLNLISSVNSLPLADSSRIGLWGHSNGGQIALSVLEITGKSYPTSLWAPVSLGFPESVLIYLGEPEVGNVVKDKIDEFSLQHNPNDYSIAEYLSQVKAPIIIHQGTADELIKTEWTKNLVNRLKSQGLAIDYYTYPGLNHNFNNVKTAAETLRERDVEFFEKWLSRAR